jgi:hypothetical protein
MLHLWDWANKIVPCVINDLQSSIAYLEIGIKYNHEGEETIFLILTIYNIYQKNHFNPII